MYCSLHHKSEVDELLRGVVKVDVVLNAVSKNTNLCGSMMMTEALTFGLNSQQSEGTNSCTPF